MPEFYDDIDHKQNETIGFVPENLSSFPAGARLSRIIYRTDLIGWYGCIDGTGDTTLAAKWVRLLGIGASSDVNFFEDLTSQIDGLKVKFFTTYDYTNLRVFFNGKLMCKDAFFTESANKEITTDYAPRAGVNPDVLTVVYDRV